MSDELTDVMTHGLRRALEAGLSLPFRVALVGANGASYRCTISENYDVTDEKMDGEDFAMPVTFTCVDSEGRRFDAAIGEQDLELH